MKRDETRLSNQVWNRTSGQSAAAFQTTSSKKVSRDFDLDRHSMTQPSGVFFLANMKNFNMTFCFYLFFVPPVCVRVAWGGFTADKSKRMYKITSEGGGRTRRGSQHYLALMFPSVQLCLFLSSHHHVFRSPANQQWTNPLPVFRGTAQEAAGVEDVHVNSPGMQWMNPTVQDENINP